jgi:hypothetical protein
MNANITNAIFRGLSDSLSAAIDTGNGDEVAGVLKDAEDSLAAGQITVQNRGELQLDVEVAGYDY